MIRGHSSPPPPVSHHSFPLMQSSEKQMRDGEGSLQACLDFGPPSELGPRWSLLRRRNRCVSPDQQALMEGYVASAESTDLLSRRAGETGRGAHPATYAPGSDRQWMPLKRRDRQQN